jgi:hypothetical protein
MLHDCLEQNMGLQTRSTLRLLEGAALHTPANLNAGPTPRMRYFSSDIAAISLTGPRAMLVGIGSPSHRALLPAVFADQCWRFG